MGIVVYNDLPDGAISFNRTVARESARSCPPNSSCTSSQSVMAKTLQNQQTKATIAANSRTMASRPQPPNLPHRPTTLRPPKLNSRSDNFLVYETVDKPAQVRDFDNFFSLFHLRQAASRWDRLLRARCALLFGSTWLMAYDPIWTLLVLNDLNERGFCFFRVKFSNCFYGGCKRGLRTLFDKAFPDSAENCLVRRF